MDDRSVEIADGTLKRLDSRYLITERIGGLIVIGIFSSALFLGVVIVWLIGSVPAWVKLVVLASWPVLSGLLLWLLMRLPYWNYKHTSYRVSPIGIEIRKGIIWKRIISVPRSRIQHTDVEQGPLMRRYGLAKLTVHTAGTEQASVNLSGVAHETALQIRDFLIHGDSSDVV